MSLSDFCSCFILWWDVAQNMAVAAQLSLEAAMHIDVCIKCLFYGVLAM
jgi:hypothetical protein